MQGRRSTDAAAIRQRMHEQEFKHQLFMLRHEAILKKEGGGEIEEAGTGNDDDVLLRQLYYELADPDIDAFKGATAAIVLLRRRFHAKDA